MTQRHPDLMLPPIPKEFFGMSGCVHIADDVLAA
jgi:hypothetical protein